MKLLSISIAAYNMEQYIEKALNSLIDERIIDNLEVFIIDDGGEDRTLEIAQKYAEQYPNSIIPVHKENGGYGSTINYSIQHATGKYFKILDGDDWFERDNFYYFIQILKTTDADVVITERCDVGSSDSETNIRDHMNINNPFEVKKISDAVDLQVLPHQALTYKTEVLRKSNIILPGLLYVDMIYTIIPFKIVKDILITKLIVYFYRIDREGQSSGKLERVKRRGEQIEVLRQIMSFCSRIKNENCSNYAYIRKAVVLYYIYVLKSLLIQPVSVAAQQEIIDFENEMKILSKDIYYEVAHSPYKMSKFLYWMRKTNYRTYWLISFVPERMKK